MNTICDYHFKDGESIDVYSLKVSDVYPGAAVIKNGTLLFQPPEGFSSELIFSPEGLIRNTVVKVTLYGARGEGTLSGEFFINNADYADVTGKVNVNGYNSIILTTRDDRPFEFKGYKIELE